MSALPQNEKISVLIADDHDLVRDALAQALMKDGRFSVSVANDYSATMAEIERLGAINFLLLDIVMPGMNGLESVTDFVNACEGGCVAVFSGNLSPDFVDAAIARGARGFIPKTLPLRSLATAIMLINSGQIFVPVRSDSQVKEAKSNDSDQLTQRELEILNLVSSGETNKEISWKIGLVEMTVKMHMRSICLKLNAKNRTHASMIAAKAGLLVSS